VLQTGCGSGVGLEKTWVRTPLQHTYHILCLCAATQRNKAVARTS